MSWWNQVAGEFGIDLGTANTVVCHPQRGVILNEASVMLLSLDGQRAKPLLLGNSARDLVGRTPLGTRIVRPLQDGVVTDLAAARLFVLTVLHQVTSRPWERVMPAAVIGVPAGASSLERRALREVAEEAGFGKIHLIPEPIAGAIGCGLDPLSRRAQMVVDIGGGTAEVSVFCSGGLLATRSCRVAGDEMTDALLRYVRERHGVLIGDVDAEMAKIAASKGEDSIEVEGRDILTGRPRLVHLTSQDVVEATRPVIESIIDTLARCLDDLPPRTVGDIRREGVLAFGGGSLSRGLSELLADAFGFQVRTADRPLTCVAEGATACLRRPDVLRAFAEPGQYVAVA